MRSFGLPVIVAANHFKSDTASEHERLAALCIKELGVQSVVCRHWAEGGAGAADLAQAVVSLCEEPSQFKTLYTDEMPLAEKISKIATSLYGASNIRIENRAAARLREIETAGYGHLPVCMAKTQYSFTTDPSVMGAPTGHEIPIRDVRLSAGAGFVVVICGDIMTMPGLPRIPAAERMFVNKRGLIQGLD